MRKIYYSILSLLLAGTSLSAHEIHFDRPARANGEEDKWNILDPIWQKYSLPVGNGSMGITTFGGVEEEVLHFTIDSLWSGRYAADADNPDAYKVLPEVRKLLLEGEYIEAEALSRLHLGAAGEARETAFGSFSVFGRLLVQSDRSFEQVSDYSRSLDLSDATARVTYAHDGTTYTRTLIASYPDQCAILRYSADSPGKQNLRIVFETPHNTPEHQALKVSTEGNDLIISGTYPTSELQLDARVRVRTEGGSVRAGKDYLEIKNADTVEIFLAADTSYDKSVENFLGASRATEVRDRLDQATQFTHAELNERHLADYQELFDRVSLNLGDSGEAVRALPMEARLERYQGGAADPDLEEMIFDYGRYLMIASSRPGSLPANLQGVWNNSTTPPWSGDYHLDINLQMNYWLTGSTNLLECQEPLIDFLEILQRNGRKTAQAYHNAAGWTAILTSNIWGYTSPNLSLRELKPGTWSEQRQRFAPAPMFWNYFPSVGPWIAHHAYEHFAFGQDHEMLEQRLWPILSGSADFICDFLEPLPNGYYSAWPSWSPEHGNISKGATAAIAISREVLTSALRMADQLGIADERTERYAHVLDNLLPYQIGQHGQLQEWYEDRDDPESTHRHVNHLIGLHPGSQISPLTTPELAEAARTSLSQRSTMSTGWSLGWKMNLMTRLLDGDEAYYITRLFLEKRVTPNLFCQHPPFQIDGNFAITAGIAEMLVQSHLGEIHILPALPEAWPNGSVRGLRARGGFTVDVDWAAGKMTRLVIQSDQGSPCTVRYGDRLIRLDIASGETVILDRTRQP